MSAHRVVSESSPLILGSQSPRRSEILRGLGVPFVVRPADVDERTIAGETAEGYVERIAALKLEAVCAMSRDAVAVLVADTIVVLDGAILGKPTDVADAERIVGSLVGRSHRVLTRYMVATESETVGRTIESEVWMRAASPDEVSRYAATGEGLDKAGAYAIQGIGTFLVERIVGSYTNVVGLPACEVVADLVRLGVLEAFPRAVSAA